VDCFDRSKIDKLVEKLNSSKGVFRSALSQNMNMRTVPQIIFIKDSAIDRSLAIENAFKGIK
jgi:ribosome-binding factor A